METLVVTSEHVQCVNTEWHPAGPVREKWLFHKNFKGKFLACPWVSNLPSNCIRNWPLPTGAIQDQCKKKKKNKYSEKHSLLKDPNWQISWLFTSIAKKLNSGQGATSAGSQNGT